LRTARIIWEPFPCIGGDKQPLLETAPVIWNEPVYFRNNLRN
jgi:hypothetical protein